MGNEDQQQQRQESQSEFGDDYVIELEGRLPDDDDDDDDDNDDNELSLSSLTLQSHPRAHRRFNRGATRSSRRALGKTNNKSTSTFASSNSSSSSSRVSFECDSGDILLAISASSGLNQLDAEDDDSDEEELVDESNPQTARSVPRRGLQHYRRQLSTSMVSLLEVDTEDGGNNNASSVVTRLDSAIIRQFGVRGTRSRRRLSRRTIS